MSRHLPFALLDVRSLPAEGAVAAEELWRGLGDPSEADVPALTERVVAVVPAAADRRVAIIALSLDNRRAVLLHRRGGEWVGELPADLDQDQRPTGRFARADEREPRGVPRDP